MPPYITAQKILITGGAGFVGSHLCEYLLYLGHHVTILDNFSTGSLHYLPTDHPHLTIITGDICDTETVISAVQEQDYIVHLAAQISVKSSIDTPAHSKKNNIDGSFNLLEACRHHKPKKIFFASSAAIYGIPHHTPIQETHPVAPLSPYGLEKLTTEHYLHLYHHLYDVPYVIGRFFNIYGERQNPASQYAGVISLFAHAILHGSPVHLYGDGTQTRDFIYVHDIVKIITHLLFSDQIGTFNCGTGIETSLIDLIAALEDIFNQEKTPIYYFDFIKGDIRRSVADISELKQHFGDLALTPLQEGLTQMMTYHH